MNDLAIDSTKSTPYILLSQKMNKVIIKGESFPENSAKFYAPVLDWLKEFLASSEAAPPVEVEFEIIYFNSSTSKIFMTIFDLLDEAVRAGKDIIVNWVCDKDNETSIECGEEFKEDLETLPFNIIIK